MRRIILLAVVLLVIPFVFAKAFSYYPVQGVQEPLQKDSAAVTALPSWNISNQVTGEITFSQMWGSPMYVKGANTTQTQGFAGPCTIVGNRTSCITTGMRRGSTFPIGTGGLGVSDMAVGRYEACNRGTARCVNNTFERCIGGFWVSTENCKRSEVCTATGCRIANNSRYGSSRFPYIKSYNYNTVKPVWIGQTIGAAN